VVGEEVVEAEPSKPTTAHPMRNFLIIAIALLAVKLLLVSRREIVSEDLDAFEYTRASLDLRSIFAGGASHPPGASLVIALARSLGIPYRVFIEIFLAVAAFLFFRPLVVSMRLGIAAITFSFGLLLFHPALILGLDRVMSDSVSFFCWLAGAGGIIGFVAASRGKLPWGSLGLTIVSFAFAGITRSAEGTVVFVEMVAVALLSIPLFRGVDSWRRRRAIVACVCAVAANFTAAQALSAWHFVHAGYWGATAVESREWWQLYSILLSLPVEHNHRHALIDKTTMDIAESFSKDLHNMSACIEQLAAHHPNEEPQNDIAAWEITICLPEDNTLKDYAKLRTISSDIIKGAQAAHLQLIPPILGVIPRSGAQWLPDLPASIIKLAVEAVRVPGSTEVTQISWEEELFNRALLRRAALVATGQNPEVFAYQSFTRKLYTALSWLFWPSVPLVFLAIASSIIRSRVTKSNLITFVLSIMVIDVLCRISFYSIVDWILWDIQLRYILGASVLTVVVVSALCTMWLAPTIGAGVRPMLMKLSWLGPKSKIAGTPTRPA